MAERSAETGGPLSDGSARPPPWAGVGALARKQESRTDPPPSAPPRLDVRTRGQPDERPRIVEGARSPFIDSARRLRLQDDITDKLLGGDSSGEPPQRQQHYGRRIARLALLLSLAAAAYGISLLMANDIETTSNDRAPASQPVAQRATPILIVEGGRGYLNEPLLLKVSLQGASGREFLLLSGLEAQTRLSAGKLVASNEWRLSPFDLGNLFAYAPHDYVGSMQAAVDLYSADDHKLASQTLRLEWIGTPRIAAVPPVSESPETERRPTKPVVEGPEAIALLERGRALFALGDIAAARVFLRRAAEAGSAHAAFLLGSSFDPRGLREAGAIGIAPDVAQARYWYEKAAVLGLSEATGKIERLGASN